MFKKFIARPAGLLAALCLATGSHAAVVTKNFNFLSNEFTLKAALTYDNQNYTAFGATSDYTLTIYEFTTTLSNFTLPTLKVAVTPWYNYIAFSGGSSSSLDADMNDVVFSLSFSQITAAYTYSKPPGDYSGQQSVTALSFNQDAYVPPAPTVNPGSSANNIPEPGTLSLLALAGAGLVAARRRQAPAAAGWARVI